MISQVELYNFSNLIEPDSSKTHFGLLKMSNSWANDDTYKLIGPNMTNSISVRITRAKIEEKAKEAPEDYKSEVQVYLNPECRYAISIRPNLSEMFGQIVRFYYPLLLPLSISIVLMIIAHQLNLLEKEGQGIIHILRKHLYSTVYDLTSSFRWVNLKKFFTLAQISPKKAPNYDPEHNPPKEKMLSQGRLVEI